MAILTRPKMIVEGAFRLTPDDAKRIWANLTDYLALDVASVDIQQRKSNAFDERAPGALSFAVNNDDKAFTDNYASSPFYPGVTQNAPLRVRIQYPETVNLLPGAVSRTDDENFWTAQQGELDLSTTSPAAGVSSSVVWTTGVLEQTGIMVMCDSGIWDNPGDVPVYVKAGEAYSARVALKASAASTISCSLRMQWYDVKGVAITEETSSTVALTTSFQTLSITNKTAPANGTLRIAIANETTITPAVRAIAYSDGDDRRKQWEKWVELTTPDGSFVGDCALVFIRLSDKAKTVTTPSGWTAVNNWSDARGRTYLFRKVLTNKDMHKTVRWNTSGKCRIYGSIITYSGTHQTTPLTPTPTETTETIKRTTHTTPNITTVNANQWIVSAVFDVSNSTQTYGAPGAEIVRQFGFGHGGNTVTGIITDDEIAHAAGTYGTKAFTANNSSRFATMHTIALNPATGTGPGTVDVYIGAPMVVKASSLPSFVQSGDWKYLITAYADSWEPHWDLNHAIVDVNATDRTKKLEPRQVQSALESVIKDNNPVAYYLLDESGDLKKTEIGDHSPNTQPPMLPGKIGTGKGQNDEDPIKFGEGKGPDTDGKAAVIINPTNNANGYQLTAEHLGPSLGGDESISMVVFFRSTAPAGTQLTLAKACPKTKSASTRSFFEFYGLPSSYIGVKYSAVTDGTTIGAGSSFKAEENTDYFDGATHMLAGTLEFTNGQAILKLYVDGNLMDTATIATSMTNVKRMNSITIGNAYPKYARLCPGTYSNLALFNSLLDDDDMADLWEAADTAFKGESVTDRIDRVLDWKDIIGTDLDSSDVIVDRHMPDETSLLDVLRLVAATDGGTVYINGDNQVTFRSSDRKQSQFNLALTISAKDLAEQPSASQSDTLLVNDITVNRLGADTHHRRKDVDSITRFGTHERSVDTLCISKSEAVAIAGYYLSFYASPLTRFDSISIEMLLQSDLTAILSPDMWDIIRITDLPSTAIATTLDSYMEGVGYSIGTDSWLVTFDISYSIPFAVVDDVVRDIMGNVVVAR